MCLINLLGTIAEMFLIAFIKCLGYMDFHIQIFDIICEWCDLVHFMHYSLHIKS